MYLPNSLFLWPAGMSQGQCTIDVLILKLSSPGGSNIANPCKVVEREM